jgi:hypothetical protein
MLRQDARTAIPAEAARVAGTASRQDATSAAGKRGIEECERTRRAAAADDYAVVWSRFDHSTGISTPVGGVMPVVTDRAPAPAAVLAGELAEAAVYTQHSRFPAWRRPVVAHFRKAPGGWRLVGLRRDGLD